MLPNIPEASPPSLPIRPPSPALLAQQRGKPAKRALAADMADDLLQRIGRKPGLFGRAHRIARRGVRLA